jgi:hypothetical protein
MKIECPKCNTYTYKPKVDCWELGYKYGRCARMSFLGMECNPSDDIVLPVECRNKRETEMGMKRGMESVK